MKNFFLVILLMFLLSGCSVIVVLLSPAKQKTTGRTTIPRKPDFSYSLIDRQDKSYFDTITAFTAVNYNYIHHDGEKYPVSKSFVFWPNGRCYEAHNYKKSIDYFNEKEHYGKSGYYYLNNDSIFIEVFGSNGLGHGYWYEQSLLNSNNEINLDSEHWYYREPKRKNKYKVIAKDIERYKYDLTYFKDTSTSFLIHPTW